MEDRLKHVVSYISNNDSEHTDKLIQAFETALSCFGEIKDEIAESINNSVKNSYYDDIGDKVSCCQDLDVLMNFLNNNIIDLQKEKTTPKTEDIAQEVNKEVMNESIDVNDKELVYQIVPLSQNPKARFGRNIKSFYIKIKVTKSKKGKKKIQEEKLIPVFIDEKDGNLYCYDETITDYATAFSEHTLTLCDYSEKETIVKHIHPLNPTQ